MKDVFVEGKSTVGVERDGKLRTQDINIDIKFSDMKMDFKNLGFAASIFQSIANSASTMVRKLTRKNLHTDNKKHSDVADI